MRLAVAVAIAGSSAVSGVAAAQSLPADPEPGQDCSLLDDPERSPSWLRHLRWSIKAGSRGSRRMFAPSIGINLWTREVLCRRGHEVGVFVGLTDLHLLLPSMFSDYQPRLASEHVAERSRTLWKKQ